MIYAKGSIVKYEPTANGRKRARGLITSFPASCASVLKAPHHVELLADFIFQPVAKESPRVLAHFNPE
jgi:hypothetical protein